MTRRSIIVETAYGPRELNPDAPPPPAGYRRCFWCCQGRLIEDSDVAEREHRWLTVPALTDPVRWRLERANDVEDDHRAAFAASREAHPSNGLPNVMRMEF